VVIVAGLIVPGGVGFEVSGICHCLVL